MFAECIFRGVQNFVEKNGLPSLSPTWNKSVIDTLYMWFLKRD